MADARDTTPLPNSIAWDTQDSLHTKRESDWYWAVGLITVSLVLATALFGNYVFAIFIIVAGGALILQSFKAPEDLPVSITKRGITVGNEHYPFENLESFWVEIDVPEEPRLLLQSQKMFMPLIIIPIDPDEVDTDELAEYLLEFLDEEELTEPLPQKLMEWLGF